MKFDAGCLHLWHLVVDGISLAMILCFQKSVRPSFAFYGKFKHEVFYLEFRITITLVLFVFHKPFDCKSLEWLMYIGFLIVWNVITVVLCLAMAFVSSRGSILDTHARSSVVRLIYLRVPLFVGEVIYTVFSVIFAFSK